MYIELIDQFCTHFSKQIIAISSMKCSKLYKKLPYVCILDTLATCRYPKKDNKTKFIKFVRNFSNWADGEKISLIHLYTNLEYVLTNSEKKKSKLYSDTFKKISSLDNQKIYRSEIDLEFNIIRRNARPNEINCIEYARHYALLYECRNSLVHGLKEPGHPIEIENYGDSPYYDTQQSEYWELIYPTSFFHFLCENCLLGLKKYLQEHNKNPYAPYEELGIFDEIWANPKKLKASIDNSNIISKTIIKLLNIIKSL